MIKLYLHFLREITWILPTFVMKQYVNGNCWKGWAYTNHYTCTTIIIKLKCNVSYTCESGFNVVLRNDNFINTIFRYSGCLSGLTGRALDHRSLIPKFKPRRGHIWTVFHLWLRLINFGARSAHLAYRVHKSGRKTSIKYHQSSAIHHTTKEMTTMLVAHYEKIRMISSRVSVLTSSSPVCDVIFASASTISGGLSISKSWPPTTWIRW